MQKELYLIHKGNVKAVQSLLDKALDIADKFIMEYSYTEHHIHTKSCNPNDPIETQSQFLCSTCGEKINVKINWQTFFVIPAPTVSAIFKKRDKIFWKLKYRILNLDSLFSFMFIFSLFASIFIFLFSRQDFNSPFNFPLLISLLTSLIIFNLLLFYVFRFIRSRKLGKYGWIGKFDKMKKDSKNIEKLPDILFGQVPIKFKVISDDNHFITTDINHVILPNSTIWSGEEGFYWDNTLPFNKFITSKYLNSVENIFE